MSSSFASRALTWLVAALSAATVIALSATAAWAGPGYQLDSVKPSIPLGAEVPVGVAIDQSSQNIYVAELSAGLANVKPGQVEQLSSSGTPTANSPFGTGGQDFFLAVAVNPVTHGVYAYQAQGETPFGLKGESKLSTFSSAGVLGTSFAPTNAQVETLAADSSGRIFFPNSATDSVQIFSSSGALEGTVSCSGCPGGAFDTPQGVAFDSTGKLYVVDSAAGGRVVKLAPSGGSYVYASTLQSGKGAAAVGVDSSSDDVFVGDHEGSAYHVAAYNSSGTQFDDFGTGLVTGLQLEFVTGQLAVNSTTHRLYLSNPGGKQLWVFERTPSIPAPTASVKPASALGQVSASLTASVDPNGHVLSSCEFEYTNHADFLANGFANAQSAACPPLLGSTESTPIAATVSGLAPSTSYDYRIQVESYGGAAESGPQAFTTLPPLPPEVASGSASALTKTTATLAGTVNPKGGTVSNCHFEWVTDGAFQATGFSGASTKPCSQTPSGNATVAVSANVNALSAGTAYRFRLVVTNNSGTATAGDASFATVAETCSENQALCPPSGGGAQPPAALPPVGTPTPKKPLKCRKGFKKKKVRGKQKCVRVKKHRSKR